MRTNEPKTPLLAILRAATEKEREWLAKKSGTTVLYLYSLAGCTRRPGVTLAIALASATEELAKRTDGRTGTVTVEELAAMCEGCEL